MGRCRRLPVSVGGSIQTVSGRAPITSWPAIVLRTLAAARLSGVDTTIAPQIEPEFDREHLQLLIDMLSNKADELSALPSPFATQMELNVQLASERDPPLGVERSRFAYATAIITPLSHAILVSNCRTDAVRQKCQNVSP
jgi:hypothetical protein